MMRSTKSTQRSALVVAVVLGAVLSGGAALAGCFEHAVDDLTGGNSQLVFDAERWEVPVTFAKPDVPRLDRPQLPKGVADAPSTEDVKDALDGVEFAKPTLPPMMVDAPKIPDLSRWIIPTT